VEILRIRRCLVAISVIIVFLVLMLNVSAVYVYDDTELISDECIFFSDETINFNYIELDEIYCRFNDLIFDVNNTFDTNITIIDIGNVYTAEYHDEIIEFKINSSDGFAFINISGFENNQIYPIYKDGVYFEDETTDGNGIIYLNCSSWSNHTYAVMGSNFYDDVSEQDIVGVNLLAWTILIILFFGVIFLLVVSRVF